jgi:hypothetical protein
MQTIDFLFIVKYPLVSLIIFNISERQKMEKINDSAYLYETQVTMKTALTLLVSRQHIRPFHT